MKQYRYYVIAHCAHCGTMFQRQKGNINRRTKKGLPVYCSHRCARDSKRGCDSNHKICSACDQELPIGEFRLRTEKRRGRSFEYHNNICKECDNEAQKSRYQNLRHDPDFVKLNRQRAKRYRDERIDEVKERDKKRRSTPEYKAMMRKYREKNAERIAEFHKHVAYEFHRKNCDALTDTYLVSRIRTTHPDLSRIEILDDRELLELRRTQILIYRLKKVIHGKK